MINAIKIRNRKVIVQVIERDCLNDRSAKRKHSIISIKHENKTYHQLGEGDAAIGRQLIKVVADINKDPDSIVPKILRVFITAFDDEFTIDWPAVTSEAPGDETTTEALADNKNKADIEPTMEDLILENLIPLNDPKTQEAGSEA